MFTKDIYVHYGGREKYGEKAAVHFARAFIVVVTVIAYLVALYLKSKQGIFEIAIRFAFSGFAAMAPVMIAALFWKRSTKWGALASTLFVAATLTGFALLQGKPVLPPPPVKPVVTLATAAKVDAAAAKPIVPAPAKNPEHVAAADSADVKINTSDATNAVTAPAPAAHPKPAVAAAAAPKPKMDIIWQVGSHVVLSRAPATGDVRFWNDSPNPAGGYMTVVPMVFGSALCMIIFSLLTRPPSRTTINKYFSQSH
jgi:Na+(H+)/acetate symporter ActP